MRYSFSGELVRDLPLIVATLPIFSKTYYANRPFDETTLDPPLGSGPYTVGDVKQGRTITYKRNPDYWAKDLPVNRGRFNFDEIKFEYFRDRTASMEAFKAGAYDFREEFTSKVWANEYDFPAIRAGKVKKEVIPDETPSGTQGYFLNTRREQLKDPRVRRALDLAFDFEWTNRNLFYGLYNRTESFFENSTMKAEGEPSPEERALLENLGVTVPPAALGPAYLPSKTDGSGNIRDKLQAAGKLLDEAGWTIKNGVRVNDKGEMVVSVAVPVQRMRAVLGVLLLSTRGGDIDNIVAAERWGIVRVSLFAAAVTVVLSVILANTIAGPVQRLSAAAERVRHSVRARAEIPDFTDRTDEIGHLSGALRDMTHALYRRIDAIESFAADVAHELKNPLTSLRSATETLPLVTTDESRDRLMEIIQHDVRRLNRLISDISDASRLDAELAREDATPVDVADLLRTTVALFNDIHRDDTPEVVLEIAYAAGAHPYRTTGHDSRLSQVITNLLDNAISFSPPEGRVTVAARRVGPEIQIAVEDGGPGIPPENLERIFERFYTDRPHQGFGQNSGLGLSISKQIIEAHGGRIWAENRAGPPDEDGQPTVAGARFVVRLPAQ